MKEWRSRLSRATRVVTAVGIVALVLLYAVAWPLFQAKLIPATVFTFGDLSGERSLAVWFTSAMLLVVALLCLVAAATVQTRRTRAGYQGVAAAAIYLSIDETTSIHENFDEILGFGAEAVTYAWVLPGLVVATLGLAALAWAVRPLPPPLRRGLAGAAAIYLAGALGVEAVTGATIRLLRMPPTSPLRPVLVTLEEGLEMVGCAMALVLMMRHVSARLQQFPVPGAPR